MRHSVETGATGMGESVDQVTRRLIGFDPAVP